MPSYRARKVSPCKDSGISGANRRNSLKSTGPRTEVGKEQSRRNAYRHGLTAETVITCLEDLEDYKAFEATLIADYDPETAVERELAHIGRVELVHQGPVIAASEDDVRRRVAPGVAIAEVPADLGVDPLDRPVDHVDHPASIAGISGQQR